MCAIGTIAWVLIPGILVAASSHAVEADRRVERRIAGGLVAVIARVRDGKAQCENPQSWEWGADGSHLVSRRTRVRDRSHSLRGRPPAPERSERRVPQ